MELKEVEVGMAVTYEAGDPDLKEYGIVKQITGDNHVSVVYDCNGLWVIYYKYKGVDTHITNLVKGWV